jgi:hypothetical protein
MDKSPNARFSYLKEWLAPYLKSRDAMQKQIVEIADADYGFLVRYVSRQGFFLIEPKPGDISGAVSRLPVSGSAEVTAVFFNTKENFKAVVDSWKSLAAIRNLKLIFVNPESEEETKWVVAPYVHSLVCDEHSVARGLKSMFSMVEPLTEPKIEKMTRKKQL